MNQNVSFNLFNLMSGAIMVTCGLNICFNQPFVLAKVLIYKCAYALQYYNNEHPALGAN